MWSWKPGRWEGSIEQVQPYNVGIVLHELGERILLARLDGGVVSDNGRHGTECRSWRQDVLHL